MTENRLQIIKLYKIIPKNEADSFNNFFIEELLCGLNDFPLSETQKELDYIEINYNSKNWNTLTNFFKYLKSSKKNKEVIYMNTSNDFIRIIYFNDLLNQIKRNDFGFIELVIAIPQENFSKNSLISLIKIINKFLKIDYGYSFKLQKNQDILTEIIEEKNIFKKLFHNQTKIKREKWNERNLKLLEVKNEIIPKIYEFNIWNNTQMKNIKTALLHKPISKGLFHNIILR